MGTEGSRYETEWPRLSVFLFAAVPAILDAAPKLRVTLHDVVQGMPHASWSEACFCPTMTPSNMQRSATEVRFGLPSMSHCAVRHTQCVVYVVQDASVVYSIAGMLRQLVSHNSLSHRVICCIDVAGCRPHLLAALLCCGQCCNVKRLSAAKKWWSCVAS